MEQILSRLKQFIAGVTVLAGLLGGTLVLAPPALAANCRLPDGGTGVIQADGHTCCPGGTSTSTSSCLFAKYVNPAVNLLAAAVGVVVVIAIIVGGIEYASSAGDPQRAAAGKQHITNALIGLLAYLVLFAFLQFILPGGLL